jgi:hypothetical protein
MKTKLLTLLAIATILVSCRNAKEDAENYKVGNRYLKWAHYAVLKSDKDNPFEADTVTILGIENGYIRYVKSRDIQFSDILSHSCSISDFEDSTRKLN